MSLLDCDYVKMLSLRACVVSLRRNSWVVETGLGFLNELVVLRRVNVKQCAEHILALMVDYCIMSLIYRVPTQ